MVRHRISAPERRQALVDVAKDLFTQKGFDAVSTRELTKAAGVSQALLYKHFPSKGSLYTAIRGACLSGDVREEYRKVLSLKPSTSTLVRLAHFVASSKIFRRDAGRKALDLLMVRSLLEDGEFVRKMHQDLGSAWHAKFDQSLKAAVRAGEADAVPSAVEMAPLLAQALGMGLMLYLRPRKPMVTVRAAPERILERCVWFILLGVGVKPEAIRRYYDPKKWAARVS